MKFKRKLHKQHVVKLVITTGIVVGTFLPAVTPAYAFHAAMLTLAVNLLWVWE